MTLDRKTPPMPQAIEQFNLAKASSHALSNGTGVHFINLGEQKIVRIEFIINAGTWNELEKGQSYFALKMLNEGTSKLNATAIAEFIANYGAFLEFNHGADRINITLYALEKHLKTLIPLVADLLQDSQYKTQDFLNLKNITNQGLKVNLEKTSFVASRLFREKLFGTKHPYGSNFEVKEVEQLAIDQVKKFYQQFIKGLHNLQIFVAGSYDQDLIFKLLNDNFGQHTNVIATNKSIVTTGDKVKNFSIEKEGALQTSIRLGKQIMNRTHPDYQKFLVVNEILGGFFGSRLMKNIREDKGFTYGIGSSINVFEHEAYLVIGTDVKKEVAAQTLEEIAKEINILQTTLVDEEELAIVKNYILGSFMGSINTPFSLIDKYKTLHYSKLNYDYYDRYYATISQISAETVREIAQQYLNYDDMVKISVG
ncbi:MAG: hypothetical protein RL060_1941 [Bacteroidota bacterium]|jgi:predicted Zn-dependent peptidase